MSYRAIDQGTSATWPLKPINKYAEQLYPKPTLIEVNGNVVRLRQSTHAEIFLIRKEDGSFYNVDRPWIRQYYQSLENLKTPENCFENIYKFYTPWIIDEDLDVSFESPGIDTPFHIFKTSAKFFKIPENIDFLEPLFVPFSFRSSGSHMDIDEKFGKVKRLSPMYDMVFTASDILLERIRKFYEHN